MNSRSEHTNFYRIALFLALFWTLGLFANPLDSIGVEVKNGKKYIQHKIEPKETLYRLSRIYKVDVNEIKNENPSIESEFKEGKIVLIPLKTTTNNPTPVNNNVSEEFGTHTVESGQGLYSIAKMYNMPVADLKKINNLTDNAVKLGQVLKVKINKEPQVEKAQPVVSKKNFKVIDTLKIKTYSKSDGPTIKNYHVGVATVMNTPNDAFEAFYNEGSVGQFINVRNMLNDEKVFIKVIGKIPSQSDNKIVIVLSSKAMERLQTSDNKIPVEVSYIAP